MYNDKIGKFSGLDRALSQKKSPNAYLQKTSHYLNIPKSVCLPWYAAACDSVISQVIPRLQAVEAIFLVGGFADCEILHQSFNNIDVECVPGPVVPENPGLAVVKGAVKYGPIPKAIASRVSHATYGVKICVPFKEGHDVQKRFYVRSRSCHYCRDIFDVFVVKGKEVDPSKPYTDVLAPIEKDQNAISCQIYACNSKNPKYVTDEDSIEIGSLSVKLKPLPLNAVTDNRSIEVTMDFSGPEIFVRVKDITDGNGPGGDISECTLDFLPVKNYRQRK